MMDISTAQARLDDASARADATALWWPDSPLPSVLRKIIRMLQYILDNWPTDVEALKARVSALEADVATLKTRLPPL